MSWLWKLWVVIAGALLVVGGVAWVLKLWVIVATDAAGAFFDLGLWSLLAGSTGLGVRLAAGQAPAMRGATAAVGPAAFVLSFFLFTAIGYGIVAAGRAVAGDALPAYLLEEGGIFISALAWLAVGVWLVGGVTLRATPETRAALRAAGPLPRTR